MHWKVVEGRLAPHASVAVRNRNGMAFGTLCWIEQDRLMIELDGELDAAEHCQLRVDVSPLRGTVLVEGRALRQLVTASDEMPRYVLKLLSVAEADIPTYDAWLDRIPAQGSSHRETSILSGISTASAASAARAATSPSSARSTSGIIDRRPASTLSSTVPAPVSTSGSGATSARDRLREALRGLARRPTEADLRK